MQNKSNQNSKHNMTRMIAEAGILIALGTVLGFLKLWSMPQGGSVTLGSLLPIIIFAYRWGGVYGTLMGAVFGLVQFLIDPSGLTNIPAIALDYPIACAGVGMSGFLTYRSKDYELVVIGATAGIALKYLSHVLSGVIFYHMYAPEGVSAWQHSFMYNLFLFPELVISIVLLSLLYRQPVMARY